MPPPLKRAGRRRSSTFWGGETSVRPPTPDELNSINRGGGWGSYEDESVRACLKVRAATEDTDHNLGFRTVQTGCRQILTLTP